MTNPTDIQQVGRGFTPGPWFMSGVRFRMNDSEWHGINRYDEAIKQDENICCVGFDARTGVGLADARLIAAAPDMFAALEHILGGALSLPRFAEGEARAALAKATGAQ